MKKTIAKKKSPKKVEAKKKTVTQKSKPAAKNVLQLKKAKAPQKLQGHNNKNLWHRLPKFILLLHL